MLLLYLAALAAANLALDTLSIAAARRRAPEPLDFTGLSVEDAAMLAAVDDVDDLLYVWGVR